DLVGVGVAIATREPLDDALRIGVPRAHADVERAIVVGDVELGALRRRLAFVGEVLREARVGADPLPGLVVELAVDGGRNGGANGAQVLEAIVAAALRKRVQGRQHDDGNGQRARHRNPTMSRRGDLFQEIGKIYAGREAGRRGCYFVAAAALAAGAASAAASLLMRMP